MQGPKWPFLLRYGSRNTRRIDFPQVDGKSTNPRVLGRHSHTRFPKRRNMKELCSSASKEPCSSVSKEPCSLVSKEPCSSVSKEPCSSASKEPCSSVSKGPCIPVLKNLIAQKAK